MTCAEIKKHETKLYVFVFVCIYIKLMMEMGMCRRTDHRADTMHICQYYRHIQFDFWQNCVFFIRVCFYCLQFVFQSQFVVLLLAYINII